MCCAVIIRLHQRGDLTGKVAFVAGVSDDQGYGWNIAKSLAEVDRFKVPDWWLCRQQ